jgi:hypothetical protein
MLIRETILHQLLFITVTLPQVMRKPFAFTLFFIAWAFILLHSAVPHYHSQCETEKGTHLVEQETSFQNILSIVFSKYSDEAHLEHIQHERIGNFAQDISVSLFVSAPIPSFLNVDLHRVFQRNTTPVAAHIAFIVQQYFSGILGHYSLTAPPAL